MTLKEYFKEWKNVKRNDIYICDKKQMTKKEFDKLPKKDQKNVNETMKILRKYRPNLEIGKVENGWVHLKNKDDKDYKDKSYTDRELNVIE
jgi:NAD(P)H-flavin reductase